jgi:hypothetical protein
LAGILDSRWADFPMRLFVSRKHLRLYPALLMCMLFNVGLHLRYGKELFLYSPNWTYALILLMGLAWQGISQRRWFQAILLTVSFSAGF